MNPFKNPIFWFLCIPGIFYWGFDANKEFAGDVVPIVGEIIAGIIGLIIMWFIGCGAIYFFTEVTQEVKKERREVSINWEYIWGWIAIPLVIYLVFKFGPVGMDGPPRFFGESR